MELQYKQFRARIYFSAEADAFYGEVLEVPWLITFQAKDPQEASMLMIEAITRYLSYLEASSLMPSTVLEF